MNTLGAGGGAFARGLSGLLERKGSSYLWLDYGFNCQHDQRYEHHPLKRPQNEWNDAPFCKKDSTELRMARILHSMFPNRSKDYAETSNKISRHLPKRIVASQGFQSAFLEIKQRSLPLLPESLERQKESKRINKINNSFGMFW